ncbi:MAG: SUMF1/EgtB/PvdO family nonheme iron enzyme [Planctomycetaceae bacterium]|nr:SUMF1/EgtB/PvdO family nonheme iron enzyme [Planctomycetaceae bacterium]
MRHITPALCFTCLAFSIIGCGGDDPVPASGTGAQNQGTQVKPKAVGVQPGAIKQKSTAQGSRNANGGSGNSTESDLPPGVDVDDVFEVSADANSVVIAATPEERNTFIITARPQPGADSNTFENPNRSGTSTIRPGVQAPNRIQVGSNTNADTERLPENIKPLREAGVDETSNLPIRVRNEKDEAELILIPAGTTIRGTNLGPANAAPEHHVYLDYYYICEHEVTLAQYMTYHKIAEEESRKRPIPLPSNEGDNPNMPALGIPQQEARRYAEWAGGLLPTEAQWEKAARGPEGYKYPWGNGRPIWPERRDPQVISPVKSYLGDVSTYGIYDLAGNAREWTLDVYSDDAYQVAGETGGKLLENPVGPKARAGMYGRVIKGGDDWKAWNRSEARFSQGLPTVGFRYVIPVKKPDSEEEGSENGDSPRRQTARP